MLTVLNYYYNYDFFYYNFYSHCHYTTTTNDKNNKNNNFNNNNNNNNSKTHGPLKIRPNWFSVLQLRRTAGSVSHRPGWSKVGSKTGTFSNNNKIFVDHCSATGSLRGTTGCAASHIRHRQTFVISQVFYASCKFCYLDNIRTWFSSMKTMTKIVKNEK